MILLGGYKMNGEEFVKSIQCLIRLPIKSITQAPDDDSVFFEFEGYNLMLSQSLEHYGYELSLYKDSGNPDEEEEECLNPIAKLDLEPDNSGYIKDLKGLQEIIQQTIEEWD